MTDYKLWYLGRSLSKHKTYGGWTWNMLSNDDEFVTMAAKHGLTAYQIKCIRVGFQGKAFDEIQSQAGKFPFGVHKGKRYEDLPERYIVWCSQQPWLDKWPVVKDYVNKFYRERDGGLSREEIDKIFNEHKSNIQNLQGSGHSNLP